MLISLNEIEALGGIVSDVADFVGKTVSKYLGKDTAQPTGGSATLTPTKPGSTTTTEDKPNYLLYGGIAAGVGIVGYLLLRKKPRKGKK